MPTAEELAAAVRQTDPTNDESLPAPVLTLLWEGRKKLDAERRERELREEAAAGARRALYAVNAATAARELVQLEPKSARLMPYAAAVENECNYAAPPDFFGMLFEFKIRGFQPVRVWVQRRRVAEGGAWGPWELGRWSVDFDDDTPPQPCDSLAVALAHARERWLKLHKDFADVPF